MNEEKVYKGKGLIGAAKKNDEYRLYEYRE